MGSLSAKTHDLFSSGVYLPLSRLQRWLHPSRRAAMLACYEGMKLRRETTNWSADRKRDWMLSRLRFSLRRAYAGTAYYREHFDRVGFDPNSEFNFDDFAKLPALERGDIRNAGRDLISRTIPREQLQRDSTGGSTGEPTEIWLGPEE